MIWLFFLLAIVIIYLAVTQRLHGIEERLERYWEKLKIAIEYMREDVSDVEAEIGMESSKVRSSAHQPKTHSAKTDQD